MVASTSELFSAANTITVVDKQLSIVLHPIILDYFIGIVARKENGYKYNFQATFLQNIVLAYATIPHNLVWNIKVDATLALAEEQYQHLLVELEIKDPHEQRMKGTTLKILRMIGDCNVKKLNRYDKEKRGEKDYGLVERIRPAFSSIPDEYSKQSQEWLKNKDSEEAQKIMKTVVGAMEKLCLQICESKEFTDYQKFKEYFNSSIANEFRDAIKPNPNHVVTEGFVWDFRIFLEFIRIYKHYVDNKNVEDKNRPNLGGLGALKSDLFDVIVYSSFWSRVPRTDVPYIKRGFRFVDKWRVDDLADHKMPERIDYTNGVPKDLVGFGHEFIFGMQGFRHSIEAKRSNHAGCGWYWSGIFDCGKHGVVEYEKPPGFAVKSIHQMYESKISKVEPIPSAKANGLNY